MLKSKLTLVFAISWTILITILSLINLKSFGNIGSGIHIENKDKIVHFTFYFVFVLFWGMFFERKNNDNPKILLNVLIAAISYGILMEICQGVFTTYRTADIFDVFANSTGAFVGFLFVKKNSAIKN